MSDTKLCMLSKCNLAPDETFAIDVVDKLLHSHDGNFFILTIIDHYSCFLETLSRPKVTFHSIIKALNDYFFRYEIPKILLSGGIKSYI